jgi:hypothetical protein
MKITEMESLIYLKIKLKQQKLNSQVFTCKKKCFTAGPENRLNWLQLMCN